MGPWGLEHTLTAVPLTFCRLLFRNEGTESWVGGRRMVLPKFPHADGRDMGMRKGGRKKEGGKRRRRGSRREGDGGRGREEKGKGISTWTHIP